MVSPAALARSEHRERSGVPRRGRTARPQAGDGLQVVVQHLGPLAEDQPERLGSPLQSGISTSTRHPPAALPDGTDDGEEPRGATIWEVVERPP